MTRPANPNPHWSEPVPITLEINPAEGVTVLGVYRVRAKTVDGNWLRIPRALREDAEGALYIGMADRDSLKARIGHLAHIPKPIGEWQKDPHELMETWRRFDLDRLADGIRTRLFVQWYECDDPRAEEGRLLEQYKAKYGDIPPGNRAAGSRN